jgi:uncharacterized protein (DUF1697 family)
MAATASTLSQQVAFLRAINVGGRAIVKMDDLQGAFMEAGCANVRTFIASGNILFDAPGQNDARLRAGIRSAVARLLGGEPLIAYRSMRQLARLVRRAPFGDLTADRAVKLYVVFAIEKAKRRPAFPLALPKEGLEAIGRVGDDVLIVSRRKPNGMYGFPNNWIEKELGMRATARNWTTVTKIVALEERARR